MAQGCVQGPQGFGSLDRKEHVVTLEVEMGEGSGAIAQLSRPFQCLQMSWNGIMGGGRKNQQVCKKKLGNQGQGVDCSLSLGRGLMQPKPSCPQTYHVDEYGLELLTAPLPPPPLPECWDYRYHHTWFLQYWDGIRAYAPQASNLPAELHPRLAMWSLKPIPTIAFCFSPKYSEAKERISQRVEYK